MFNWLKKLFHREEKSTATVAIPETPQLLEKPCRTCGKPVFYDPSWEHIPNYSALVAKVERKGRTKAEVDECIRWLTGYVSIDILDGLTYGEFLSLAPKWNPRAELITGTVCGIRVEEIADPQEKRMRQLDKMVDELAKGKPMAEVLR